MPRTYIYKLTSDRGGAPSAPPPRPGDTPLLTLSICKPAIRRTAQPGDRVLGITSQALVQAEGYPVAAVIYAAVIDGAVDAREYYAARSPFRHRPDCIYRFHRANGTIEHAGVTPLHADPAYRSRDIGQYPFYRNGRTLLSRSFRYFGREAVAVPPKLLSLRHIAESLGQGHRVLEENDPAQAEVEVLMKMLWRRPTLYTPSMVAEEARGHTPRSHAASGDDMRTRRQQIGGPHLPRRP